MSEKVLSQRTLVAVMRSLGAYGSIMVELLYEHDFPEWFIKHADTHYHFDWQDIIMDIRSTQFFFPHDHFGRPGESITDQPDLSQGEAQVIGEACLGRLAALASTLPDGEPVSRSLQLDGFDVNKQQLELVPIDSVTSEREEEDRVTFLVDKSGLTNATIILKHIQDARELFLQGKDHPATGEARDFIQVLIDSISADTDAHGGHFVGYPRGTANRLKYLEDVGFLTADEKAAFGSAWGFLAAGTHPGIPSRDEARIGLILSLEFGVVLLLKFANWKANGFERFS